MYKAVSGAKKSPTDQGELSGILQKLGYDKEQVYHSTKDETNDRFTNFRFAVIGAHDREIDDAMCSRNYNQSPPFQRDVYTWTGDKLKQYMK